MVRSVLVTGARGYLGGRLIGELAQDPNMAVTGTTRNANRTAPPGWPRQCRLISLDPLLQGETELAEALGEIDTVVHLSAPNEIASTRAPVQALLELGVATLKLLQAAKVAGCRRFIHVSTIHVYGSPLEGRIVETDIARPVHPYAIAHRTAEDCVLAAQSNGEIEGIALRLSNGIGAPAWPGIERWTLIGNEFSRQAVNEGRIQLRTSGLQWRDFILLCDFARAVRHTIELPATRLGDGLFNLGGRMPLRVIDVAETVAQRASLVLGKTIAVERPPAIANESPTPIDYSIDRIAATGFAPSPRSALEEEIDATLALVHATEGA